MCILFYFDRQINPERGGTERVTDILAHSFIHRGDTVFYMARYQETTQNDTEKDIQTFFLPEPNKVVSEKNITFIEDVVNKYDINYIINQGTNGNDIYLFNHEKLHIQAKIISCLHFSIYEGLNYFRELFLLEFNVKQPIRFIKDCIRWIKMPYNKHRALRNKKKRFNFIYHQSDAVVLLSPKYKDDFAQVAQIDNKTKLYSIINPTSFDFTVNKMQEKVNEIIFVGRLSFAEKRIDRILNIWKKIYLKFPEWKLSIVGDGLDRERLEILAKDLDLTNIDFLGFQSPERYYNRAKLFCMTSNHEGLPMVLLEAMQYGVVPIVYNSFGAAEDIIENYINGVLVSPFVENEYVKSLECLMTDNAYRVKLSNAAIESTKGYTVDGVIEKWYSLFYNLQRD